MKVKVTKILIRHNGKPYHEGEEFSISQDDYEKVKTHLELIDDQEEDGLAELRARAQELGVPRASQLGEKKLLEGIAEKETEQVKAESNE